VKVRRSARALALTAFVSGIATLVAACFSLSGLSGGADAGPDVALGPFLLRRYGALLAIGLVHMLFVWDGDILAEYAVAALLVTPLVRQKPRTLAVLGLALLAWWSSPHPPPKLPFPSSATMLRLAEGASRAYGHGTWAEAQAFRLHEISAGILPLLVSVLPRTVGLFLLGLAASSFVRRPPRRWLIAAA
jgi:uncharacterized protein